jgi:hypothetical protein
MKKLLFLSVLCLVQIFKASDLNSPKSNPLAISTSVTNLERSVLSPKNATPATSNIFSQRASEFQPYWLPTKIKDTLRTPYVLDASDNFLKSMLNQAVTIRESEFVCIITLKKQYSSDTHVMEEVPRVLVYNKKNLTQSPQEHVSESVRSAIIWAMFKLEPESFCC